MPFAGTQDFPAGPNGEPMGRAEWAIAWPLWSDGSYSWYCNTIPTPDGGTHEQGLRAALTKGYPRVWRAVGQKKAKDIAPEDMLTGSEIMLSLFIREPQFQSQTKDRLTSPKPRAWWKARCATISTTSSPTTWSAARRCSAR